MKRQRWWSLVLMTVLGAIISTLLTSPAQADPVDISCSSRQVTRYSPGVRLVPLMQHIKINTKASGCVSSERPDLTSGSARFAFDAERSCLSIDQTMSGTSFIKWNTGETTVYTYDSTTATIAGQIVVTIFGTVISGPFEGSSITIVVASPIIDLLKCIVGPGITKRVGVGTVLISS
jgi:hypothetical protein